MSEYKNQHFVPQTYLRFFANELYIPPNYSKESLWCINKNTKEIKLKGIKNICSHNYFYSYKESDSLYNHDIEKKLSEFENDFKTFTDKLCSIRNSVLAGTPFNKILCGEKEFILKYLLLQYFRVPKFTNDYFSKTINGFREINRNKQIEQSEQEIINDLKRYGFRLMFDLSSDRFLRIMNILYNKKMTISIIPDTNSSELITSDAPVHISNKFGKTALISLNTEITLPITPKIALTLFGPKGHDEYKIFDDSSQIDKFNKSLMKSCFENCYSGNKPLLEIL